MKQTFEIFKEQELHFENEALKDNWMFAHAASELGGLSIQIDADLNLRFNEKETRIEGERPKERDKILVAYIRWHSTTKGGVAKCFPISYEGYMQACAWLDEKRMEFANRILEWNE